MSKGPYDLFRVGKPSENSFIKSLLDLLECEDECLTIGVFKLLFAIFHTEEAVFSSAQSTYIYSDYSYKVSEWMLNLIVFNDPEKILLRMSQGCVQGKQPLYPHPCTNLYTCIFAGMVHCYKGNKICKI